MSGAALGYSSDPRPRGPFLHSLNLTANQVKEFDLPGAQSVYVVHSLKYGTGAGDVSFKLGEQGDFFDACPGMFLRVGSYGRMTVRNNTPAARQIDLLICSDPDFEVYVQPSGV